MRVVSWNVNGLRACARKGFADWLANCEADLVCLQETRVRREQLSADLADPDGWHFHLAEAERPGYSGVGIYSRTAPDVLIDTLELPEFDREGRLQIARWGKLWVANGYFPNGNGKNRDLSRIPYKLDFYRSLYDRLEPLRERDEPVLVVGDFNTAHRDIDLARPKQNRETSGFRPEERDELDRWIRSGWVDTFRHFAPEEARYSWWSQRKGVRERNVGWRIDMILASAAAMPFVRAASIHDDVFGSDHCPVSVDLDASVHDS